MAFHEIFEDAKSRPVKTAVILTGIGGTIYCCKTNPTERSFYHNVQANSNELLLLGNPIRNSYCDQYMQRIITAHNADCIQRLNLGVCSIIWLDNFGKQVDLYEARCKNIRVGWLEMYDRLIDVGFVGRWWYLKDSMDNYDINPCEWDEKDERTYPPGLSKDLIQF